MHPHRLSVSDSFAFHLADLILGSRFSTSYRRLIRSQWQTHREREGRNEERLANLLKHAAINVPFYRELYRTLGLRASDLGTVSDLVQLPVIRKEEIRANSSTHFLAENLPANRRIKVATSGSTGQPFFCFWDRESLPMLLANHIFADTWYGFGPFDRSVKFRSPRPNTMDEHTQLPLFLELKQKATTALRTIYESRTQLKVSAFEVGKRWAEDAYRRMEAFRPLFVTGHPSAIATTAHELMQRNLRLSQRVQHVITEAESLTADRKQVLEEYFEAPVANRYGMREQGAFTALSCPQNPDIFHIVSDQVVLEVVQENGVPAKPGELGMILITDLQNFIMPFIRYNTGDMGIMSSDLCSCGRTLPVLKKIEGRSYECLRTPSGRLISPVALGNYLFVHHGFINAISYYQLVQLNNERVRFLVVPGPCFHDERQRLQQVLERLLENQTVEIEIVKEIVAEKSGKRPIIKLFKQ